MEHALGDQREGDDRAELQACDGHHRHQRVLQRMAEVHGPVAQPAGARELNVVGAQHLEHLAAHQSHDERHLKQPERDRRQDKCFQAGCGQQPCRPEAEPYDFTASKRRQHAERDREQEDQQDADEERRQRNADERCRQENVGEPRSPVQRRVYAHRNADQQGEDRRRERQLQGGGKAVGDQIDHRRLELVGVAEIQPRRIGDEACELDGDWVVEAEILT